MIRYGEIALKSKITRKNFEKILRNNIKRALDKKHLSYKILKFQGRFVVETDEIDTAVVLISHVFGITSLSPAFSMNVDLKRIKHMAYLLVDTAIQPGDRFALRVTRTGTHDFTSQDIAVSVGAYVQQQDDYLVDLTDPDIEIFIEIRDDTVYVFLKKIRGPGGMPLGSQGRAITSLDTVYDALASWYLLKRGCDIIYLYSDEKVLTTVDTFFSRWHVPKNLIYCKKDGYYWKKVETIINEKHCKAFCSGIFFANKPSDVILSLNTLKKQVPIPILTPLISFEQDTLKDLCEKRGISV